MGRALEGVSISMIQLIGPGGAGKSTVGEVLALRLGRPFHDLDREFERRCADIDTFIQLHGYAAYACENVAVYLDLIPHLRGAVLALSSGFMVYPASVHSAYGEVKAAIARSRTTFVLLPSLERETCVDEIVRRQLGRPICRRNAAAEEAVIRKRFGQYVALPAAKVETMLPPIEVAAMIHALLPVDAPETSRGTIGSTGHCGAPSDVGCSARADGHRPSRRSVDCDDTQPRNSIVGAKR